MQKSTLAIWWDFSLICWEFWGTVAFSCCTGTCINGVTAELSVWNEHIKALSLYNTISHRPWCQRLRRTSPSLSGWHCSGEWPQQMAQKTHLGQAKRDHMWRTIDVSLANGEKKQGWEKKIKRIHKDIYIFTLFLPHFQFSFCWSVSGLAFLLLFVCLLVLNRLW